MASGFVQTNGRVIAGEGDPAGGDALVTNLSLFPINSLYINNNTGKLWVRNEENIVVGDWVGMSGGGGSSFLPETGTGTATGNIIGDLAGFTLNIQQGGNPFLLIDPTVNVENVTFQALNITGSSNFAATENQVSDTIAQADIRANFNAAKEAKVVAFADTSGSSITHTADTHTFNGENLQALITDGSASAGVDARATTGDDVHFGLRAKELGGDEISILGNAISNTITHTADQHIFVGLQDFATNAAAVTGGVPVGGLYYTNTAGQAVVKIVI